VSSAAQPAPSLVRAAMEAKSVEFRRNASTSVSDMSVWTKLYAANQVLLSAVSDARVSSALIEICSNLLGCEEVAIVEIDRATQAVHFLGEEGLSSEKRKALSQNVSLLLSRIGAANIAITAEGKKDSSGLAPLDISALVPLWVDVRSSAALVLFQLLPQRTGFDAEDLEVLQLLSVYAGPCLRSR